MEEHYLVPGMKYSTGKGKSRIVFIFKETRDDKVIGESTYSLGGEVRTAPKEGQVRIHTWRKFTLLGYGKILNHERKG